MRKRDPGNDGEGDGELSHLIRDTPNARVSHRKASQVALKRLLNTRKNSEQENVLENEEEKEHVVNDKSAEEPLFHCSCGTFKNFAGLPCRHVFAVLSKLYRTTLVKEVVPCRWPLETMKALADKIAIDEGDSAGQGASTAKTLEPTKDSNRKNGAYRMKQVRESFSEKKLFELSRRKCIDCASILARKDIVDVPTFVKGIMLVQLIFDSARRGSSPSEEETLQILRSDLGCSQSQKVRSLMKEARASGVSRGSLPSTSDMEDEVGDTLAERGLSECDNEEEVSEKHGDLNKPEDLSIKEKTQRGKSEEEAENTLPDVVDDTLLKKRSLSQLKAQRIFVAESNVPRESPAPLKPKEEMQFKIEIPKVRRIGRPKKILGPRERRKSYMKTRGAALQYASSTTMPSRYISGGDFGFLSIADVVQEVASERCTVGRLLDIIKKIPTILKSEVRNVVIVSKLDDSMSVSQAVTLDSCNIHFTLPRVHNHIRNIARRVSKERTGGAVNIDKEEARNEQYGILLEVCAFEGENNAISESSNIFFPQKALADMQKVTELERALLKFSLLFSWLDDIGKNHELAQPSQKEVRSWAAFTKEKLKQVHPLKNIANDSTLAFTMSSLVRFRGQFRMSCPSWLDSDCIHIALRRVEETMQRDFKDFVFFLPPYPWTDSAAFGCSTYDPKVTYKLLKDIEHPLLELDSQSLRRSLVYRIANVHNSHWVALEECLATKRMVIYDPAVRGGVDLPESEICDRFISFFHELSVAQCVPWLAEPWRMRQTLGGQQELSKDSSNCGVMAAEWISFRIASDVMLRRCKGRAHAKDPLRECRMRERSSYQWDLQRLQMLHYAARKVRMCSS